VPPQTSHAPHTTYALLFGGFGAGLAAVAGLTTLLGRRPDRLTTLDLAVLSAATFKAARTVASDEILSFVREPFVQGEAHEGQEEPVETGGPRQALGELLTCSRCIGTWAAAGLLSAQTLAPRTGRLLTGTLAVAGAHDFLQAGFAALTSKSNELERRSGGSG
jgi:Protein of unknown function (DUF1360)